MYAADQEHPLKTPCVGILRRVASEELEAVMSTELNNGLTRLLSADTHFDAIAGITRVDPRKATRR
jgi:hypothetical protein